MTSGLEECKISGDGGEEGGAAGLPEELPGVPEPADPQQSEPAVWGPDAGLRPWSPRGCPGQGPSADGGRLRKDHGWEATVFILWLFQPEDSSADGTHENPHG